jgi:hypothetical protein
MSDSIFCSMAGTCPVCGADRRACEPHAPDCPPGDPETVDAFLCGWPATVQVSPPWGGVLLVCEAHAAAIAEGRTL